jgi:hypothetical protein
VGVRIKSIPTWWVQLETYCEGDGKITPTGTRVCSLLSSERPMKDHDPMTTDQVTRMSGEIGISPPGSKGDYNSLGNTTQLQPLSFHTLILS